MTKDQLALQIIVEKNRSNEYKKIALQMIENNNSLMEQLKRAWDENRNLRFNKLVHATTERNT